VRLFRTEHIASAPRHRRLLDDREDIIVAIIRTARFVKWNKDFGIEEAN